MGCDIHFFAEKRNATTGKWEFLPAPDAEGYMPGEADKDTEGGAWPYRYGTGKDGYQGEDGDRWLRDWFDDRNYRLFGMLADVRNGTGFAGCRTGNAVEPIAMPRGWPADLSPELEAERANIEHTPTYLTVREMLDYFERKRADDLTVIGVVDGQTYENLRDNGVRPTSWSGGISGRDIVTLDARIYDMIPADKIVHEADEHPGLRESTTRVNYADLPQGIADERKDDIRTSRMFDSLRGTTTEVEERARVFVQAQWTQPALDYTSRFEHMLTEMIETAGTTPDNIRAVFYFDS